MKKHFVILSFFLVVMAVSGCSYLNEKPATSSIKAYLPESARSHGDEVKDSGKHKILKSEKNSGGMTLEKCVETALDKNPARMVAKAGIEVASEVSGQARAPFYPEISAQAGYSRFKRYNFMPGGILSSDWTANITAKIIVFDNGERISRLKSALALREAATEEAEKIRQEIIAEVHRAFYSVMAAQAAREVAVKNLERAENYLEMAENRFLSGASAKTDSLRAQVGVADARLGLVKAESLVSMAGGELNTAMGIPVETGVNIVAGLIRINEPDQKELDRAFDLAENKRPDIKAALQKISAAKYAVDEAEAAFGPEIKAQAGYGLEDEKWMPDERVWFAGVTLDLPIFTGFARTHSIAAKKAGFRKEEAETMRIVQNSRQEVWRTFLMLKEAFGAFQASESMVMDAGESLRSMAERYEAGSATMTDLLDAEVYMTRAGASRVNSQWDYFMAGIEFKKASGNL